LLRLEGWEHLPRLLYGLVASFRDLGLKSKRVFYKIICVISIKNKDMKKIKLSIKDVMCDLLIINDLFYISESDIQRIVNKKVRSTRGKKLSIDKLIDTNDQSYKIKNCIYYVFINEVDDCYHNYQVLSQL
jgi:hypothetical protein